MLNLIARRPPRSCGDLGTKLVTEQTVSPMVTFNGGLTDEEAIYRGTGDPDPAGGGIARGADPGGLSALQHYRADLLPLA